MTKRSPPRLRALESSSLLVVAGLAFVAVGCASDAVKGSGGSADFDSGGGASTDEAPGGSAGAGAGPGGGNPASAGGSSGGTGAAPDAADFGCRIDGDGLTTLVFVNRCDGPVTYRGSDIEGGEIAPSALACVDIGSATEALSSKRYWGWVGSDPGGEHHTLAEFTFNTDFNDFDWYNISHVDAHNLPLQIVPVARPDCQVLTCAQSFLAGCPTEGRFTDASGAVVACVSPERDDPNSIVAQYFESCDDAYAWSGDDQHGTDPSPMRACAGEDWDIVFCPED